MSPKTMIPTTGFMLLALLWIFPAVTQGQHANHEVHAPGIPKAQPQGTSGTITLGELIQEAGERNPAIHASQQVAQAKRELIPAAKTLPDPMFTFWHMGNVAPLSLQYGDPSSARVYTIEQDIPFPTKLGLRGKVASMEAETEEWNHALTSREIISELKQAYFDLYLTQKSLQILNRNKDLLQSLTKITETKYQVGQGIQQDILRAQVERSKLLDRQAVLEQRQNIAEAQINNLLYLPMETPVGTPADFQPAILTQSLEELLQLAQQNSPALKAKTSEVERSQYSLKLANSEYLPDFTVGFSYFDREGNPEMYGLEAKAKLPLYFWRKQRPEVNSAKASLAGAQRMRESTSSTVSFQIRQGYTTATTSNKLLKLYGTAIIPQAGLSLKSAMANYQTGKVDFFNVIDSQTALLEYELKYQESLNEYQKALAQMEPLIGIDLIHP
jgi:outer membrane protein, heavy metal efflux system